jgi:threonine dehydratase
MKDITLQDVYMARQRISAVTQKSPLLPSNPLSAVTGAQVYLKIETFQPTGSFKIRGAANKILSLSDHERVRGVITASTGNHGRAVAYIAKKLGVRATVCLSKDVPENKVKALRLLGAEVVVSGRSQDDAFDRAAELQSTEGYSFIPPFDDAGIIAGQGTIGLELLEAVPEIDAVLVPVSGGGLISGVATVAKSTSRKIKVMGISMERAPVMYHSLRAGKPVQMEEEDTLADSLRGGIGADNQYTFHIVRSLVDNIVLVSEEEIAAAIRFVFNQHRIVVEGAGAVGIAALLAGKLTNLGENIAIILSGGNVDTQSLLETLDFSRSEK